MMIGRVLSNRYEIVEEVGAGGMAIVYKARCRKLNRYVAIKVLKDEYKVDSSFVKKFNRESQAAASLSNPHIVSVYDVGHDEDIYYIVMELVEGITLKDYIEKEGMLNWRTALKFSIQICSALTHAHRNGIIHRDIKPHNIILSKDGNCKVTDFGIATVPNVNETRKLDEGILGSVHYISPEHAKGVVVDERSDLYSLGVSMYEMLTGHPPFDGDTAVSIAIKHLNQKPSPIKDVNISVPLGLVQVVEKAMNKDINLRYQSADEMLRDLEAMSKDPDVFTTGPEIELNLEGTRLITKEEQDDIKKKIVEIHEEKEQRVEESEEKAKKHKKSFFKNLFHTETKKDKVAVIAALITSAILFLAVAVVAVDIFVPGFSFSSIFSRSSREFIVPDLKGKTIEAVQEEYKNVKLELIVDEEIFSEEYEAGFIADQNPPAEMNVKLPVKIRVKVSKGAKEITLPRFIDKEYRQAQLEIKNLGLKYADPVFEYNEEVPQGYVISQSPLPNAVVKLGEEVILTVSKGVDTEYITVPNLIGLTEGAAKARLSDFNLELGGVVRQASNKPAGEVIAQSISENSEVTKKTKIVITVSNGKSPNTGTEETPHVTSTPAPQVTPTPPAQKSYSLRLELPSSKEEVTVVVKQSGSTVFNQKVSTASKTLTVPLTGTGQANVEVYYDGVLVKTQKVTF